MIMTSFVKSYVRIHIMNSLLYSSWWPMHQIYACRNFVLSKHTFLLCFACSPWAALGRCSTTNFAAKQACGMTSLSHCDVELLPLSVRGPQQYSCGCQWPCPQPAPHCTVWPRLYTMCICGCHGHMVFGKSRCTFRTLWYMVPAVNVPGTLFLIGATEWEPILGESSRPIGSYNRACQWFSAPQHPPDTLPVWLAPIPVLQVLSRGYLRNTE